jgi:ATP-dependent RNA helicase RhlB
MTDSVSTTTTEPTEPTDHRPLTDIDFDSLGLHPLLSQGLADAGFVRLTPIQALTLPVALPGRDVAGQAQTGTGKTCAFLVAVMNRLLTRPARAGRRDIDPRAVIIAPTRELAIQIDKDARAIGGHTGLRIALIYGGVDYEKQKALLEGGVDIIVATPGRLIDYVRQGTTSLREIESVVLDEADRMFDLGFIKDIRFLFRRMPPREERQSLLFSATLSHRVLELAYDHMNEPEKLTVETESITAARVRQVVYFPATDEKLRLLIGLLTRKDATRTMVFVNTKAWVERVARALEKAGFRVGVLSGDVPQQKREKLLSRFQRGELEILVATDVAARGLHIVGVSHVFNFDLPFDAEDYVHRIGRTARLGAEGDAISFACELYAPSLPDIEAYIEQRIPVEPISPELLEAIARPDRPAAPAGESIAEVFAEVRAAKAAEDQARGGKSKGPGGGRGESSRGPRGARPAGSARPPRGDRPPRDPAARTASAPAVTAVETARPTPAAPAVAHATGAELPSGDAERSRKPRRRRRGKRVDETGTHGASASAATATVAAPDAAPRHAHEESFLARLKTRLRTIINRLPGRGRSH